MADSIPVHCAKDVDGRLGGAAEIARAVRQACEQAMVVDMHTHLFPAAFSRLALSGIDELLRYHYLIAEVFRATRVTPAAFWSATPEQQSEFIWEELFVKRTPVSEAVRGIVTTLTALGRDPQAPLSEHRAWFASQPMEVRIERTFAAAGVKRVTMTNDPFDEVERAYWSIDAARDSRFDAALRLDRLLNNWPSARGELVEWGYAVGEQISGTTAVEVRRFLRDWHHRFDARYMAISLPPDFRSPSADARHSLLEECVLPVCEEDGIPFALMLGVRRGINPALRLAADSVGQSGVAALENLCSRWPRVRFMATLLAREDQHALCVTARKFSNLLPFGCWWFLNTPSLMAEITRMRMELLGFTFVPQHSDARVLEQLIYKWRHTRGVLIDVLTEHYVTLNASGWRVTDADVHRAAQDLLALNFTLICARGSESISQFSSPVGAG